MERGRREGKEPMERGRREGKEPMDEQPILKRGRKEEELDDEHREMESLIKEIHGSRSQREEETSSSSSLSAESRIERLQDLEEEQIFYNYQQLIMINEENTSNPLHQSVEIDEIPEAQQPEALGGGVNPHPPPPQIRFNPPPPPPQIRFHPPPPQIRFLPPPPPPPQFWLNPPPLWFNHLPPPPLWFNHPPPRVNPQQATGTGFFHPRPANENRVHQDGYNRGSGRGGNYRAGSRRPPLGRASGSCRNQTGRHSWRPRRGR